MLIHLVHTPAEELGAPLAIGIADPFAVFGPTMIFGVSDFSGCDFQKVCDIVRHIPLWRDDILLGMAETDREQQRQQQKQTGRPTQSAPPSFMN